MSVGVQRAAELPHRVGTVVAEAGDGDGARVVVRWLMEAWLDREEVGGAVGDLVFEFHAELVAAVAVVGRWGRGGSYAA